MESKTCFVRLNESLACLKLRYEVSARQTRAEGEYSCAFSLSSPPSSSSETQFCNLTSKILWSGARWLGWGLRAGHWPVLQSRYSWAIAKERANPGLKVAAQRGVQFVINTPQQGVQTVGQEPAFVSGCFLLASFLLFPTSLVVLSDLSRVVTPKEMVKRGGEKKVLTWQMLSNHSCMLSAYRCVNMVLLGHFQGFF